MLNALWLGLIILSVIIGVFNGTLDLVVASVTNSAKLAFEFALGLGGIMVFWLGLMRVAEEGGLIRVFTRLLQPVMSRLFPDVPSDHPAVGAMVMNIASNMLGLTNAATPFGLRAMEELQKLNQQPKVASNAMCTFLAINTSSVQLIPTTAIAFLAAAGAHHPTEIIATSLLATSCSTIAAIVTVKVFERLSMFAVEKSAR
jgi:spore maturation protein A